MTPTVRLDVVATLLWGRSWPYDASRALGINLRTLQRCWAATNSGPTHPDQRHALGAIRAIRELLTTAQRAIDAGAATSEI